MQPPLLCPSDSRTRTLLLITCSSWISSDQQLHLLKLTPFCWWCHIVNLSFIHPSYSKSWLSWSRTTSMLILHPPTPSCFCGSRATPDATNPHTSNWRGHGTILSSLGEGVFIFYPYLGIQGSLWLGWPSGEGGYRVFQELPLFYFFWLTLFLARFLNIFCTLVFHMYLCCFNLHCALYLLLCVSRCVYPERLGMHWCACATTPRDIYSIPITVPWLDH